MSEPANDPEVAADIALRNRTERQRSKIATLPIWHRPEYVANWPCRVCATPVPVTADAVDTLERFNGMLSRRNETFIRTTEIMYCDGCRAEFKRSAAARRLGQVERMRPVIQRLKRSSNPESEQELIAQLKTWGHPDVPGLLQAIRDRMTSKGRKPDRGEV